MADGRVDGAVSPDGGVYGTYVHGLFASTDARAGLMASLNLNSTGADYAASVGQALDEIAAQLELHADIDGMIEIARSG